MLLINTRKKKCFCHS